MHYIKMILRGLYNIYKDLSEKEASISHIPNSITKKIWKTALDKDILLYTFWSGEKNILINCGMHGNEIGTVKFWKFLISTLYESKMILPKNVSVYTIPCLNIDGFEEAKNSPNYFGWWSIGKLNANWINLVQNICSEQDFWKKPLAISLVKKCY